MPDRATALDHSPQFFGWVAGFGTGVVVAGPPEVRAEMKKTLDRLQDLYR